MVKIASFSNEKMCLLLKSKIIAPIAQLDRASDYGSEG